MTKDVTVRGPEVERRIRATWTVRHNWGHSVGDVREYFITKEGSTGRVHIAGFKGNDSLPADAARKIGEALVAAADWTDPRDLTEQEREALDRAKAQIRDGRGRELSDNENPSDALASQSLATEFQVQTRSMSGETLYWDTVTEAFEFAGRNNDVEKISFPDGNGRRVRLTRIWCESVDAWEYRPMEAEIAAGLDELEGEKS